MESEAGCQQAHAGHPFCKESIVVGKDSGLANAFVYIQTGLEGKLRARERSGSPSINVTACLYRA